MDDTNQIKNQSQNTQPQQDQNVTTPREVKEAGVEEVSDRLPLTDEHRAVGMEHAGESTPVDTQPKLSMSENEALKIIKTTKNSDSKHWLAVLVEKIYKILKS